MQLSERIGNLSSSSFIPGPNDSVEGGIYNHNFFDIVRLLPDESVDMIYTDPLYERIDDYYFLGLAAMRLLKPDRPLLCYCAIGSLPQVHDALRESGLTYRWRLVTQVIHSKRFFGKLIILTQECLWYEKGNSRLYDSLFDLNTSSTKGNYFVGGANWGKGFDVVRRYIDNFTHQDDLVLDPFTGSGSIPAACKQLKRRYLGFEIDPEITIAARKRVGNEQPLLIGSDQPRQISLEMEHAKGKRKSRVN